MKKTDIAPSNVPSALITERIAELGDWRGETLAHVRKLIKEADPKITEEWKWRGVPVWYHGGVGAAIRRTHFRRVKADPPECHFCA